MENNQAKHNTELLDEVRWDKKRGVVVCHNCGEINENEEPAMVHVALGECPVLRANRREQAELNAIDENRFDQEQAEIEASETFWEEAD